MNIINALPRPMPTSWQWVSFQFIMLLHTNKCMRYDNVVLNPKKKMGHFVKNWPGEVSDVEDLVRDCVCKCCIAQLIY
jgi:hypothetical protein